ncbi:hypothetical protein [Sulfurimonas sp.]|uniref:hypothetical protein n=1 Tax=Sulfurimonas sp. TaxID=2022749 RepID=UPI0025EC8B77|nr:hypothetical protein [Sulfurimonas sp.]
MIDINKAQKVITDNVTCKLLENDINREGSYLVFDDVNIKNHSNIDYNFSLFVAIALFNKDKTKIYTSLNDSLNEINQCPSLKLMRCSPYKKDGKLLIYEIKIQVNIIG